MQKKHLPVRRNKPAKCYQNHGGKEENGENHLLVEMELMLNS